MLLGASFLADIKYKIQLQPALPSIISGCRIALLVAVTVVIVVEFLSSNTGLGFGWRPGRCWPIRICH